MRVLSALLVCSIATSCVHNPDPSPPSVQSVPKMRYGSYIVVELVGGAFVSGELLAIDNGAVYVRTEVGPTQTVPLHRVRSADLYAYNSDWGFGVWGALGTLMTISHGFLLVFSAPLWMISSGVVAGVESSHMKFEIPEDDISDLVKWARYPQGMPKNLGPPGATRPTTPTVQPTVQQKSRQEEAWQLTKRGQHAARNGACDVVVELDPRVRALDEGMHQMAFLRDEAIRRCLSLPSLLPPSMTPVTSPPSAPPDAGVPLDAAP
jgi:hypothetical protein